MSARMAVFESAEPKLAAFPRSYPDSLQGRRVSLGVYEVGVADRPGGFSAA